MKLHTLLMIGIALTACLDARAEDLPAPAAENKPAAAPAAATAAPSTATPANASPASAADATAKPADQPQANEPEVSQEQDKKLRGMGYKQSKRNGKLVYCRQEAVLGSRFTKVVCGTAADLERVAQGAREQTEHMQHSGLNQLSRE